MNMYIKKGDIFLANLSPVIGSEQGGVRPVIVIQNNVGNYFSDTIIVAIITSKTYKHYLPTHMLISKEYGLLKDSIIMTEQLRTIDKCRLSKYVGSLIQSDIKKLNSILKISLEI